MVVLVYTLSKKQIIKKATASDVLLKAVMLSEQVKLRSKTNVKSC